MKPFLKWVGGKSWAVPKMRSLWLQSGASRYVDLTLGGGAIPLALAPKKTLLGDINPYLIDTWKWVQSGGRIEIDLTQEENYYYEIRDRFNSFPSHTEAPQWYYYLNHSCYRGLQRNSGRKVFNVPYGHYKFFHGTKDLLCYSGFIKDWSFQCLGWEQLLGQSESSDFILFDPPYDGTFNDYFGGFTTNDQLKAAIALSKSNAAVVAFNSPTLLMLSTYKDLGFDVTIVEAPRSIAVRDRTPAKEMIATLNISPPTNQLFLF